jgi:hypothetical protein
MAKIAVDGVTAIQGSSYDKPNAEANLAYDIAKKEGSDGLAERGAS